MSTIGDYNFPEYEPTDDVNRNTVNRGEYDAVADDDFIFPEQGQRRQALNGEQPGRLNNVGNIDPLLPEQRPLLNSEPLGHTAQDMRTPLSTRILQSSLLNISLRVGGAVSGGVIFAFGVTHGNIPLMIGGALLTAGALLFTDKAIELLTDLLERTSNSTDSEEESSSASTSFQPQIWVENKDERDDPFRSNRQVFDRQSSVETSLQYPLLSERPFV